MKTVTYYSIEYSKFDIFDIEKNIILKKMKELYDGDIENVKIDNFSKVENFLKKVRKLKVKEQINIVKYIIDNWLTRGGNNFDIKLSSILHKNFLNHIYVLNEASILFNLEHPEVFGVKPSKKEIQNIINSNYIIDDVKVRVKVLDPFDENFNDKVCEIFNISKKLILKNKLKML